MPQAMGSVNMVAAEEVAALARDLVATITGARSKKGHLYIQCGTQSVKSKYPRKGIVRLN
jgi:hypothetical protein